MNSLGWLGVIGATGLVIQIVLGYTLANDHALISALILPHIAIGMGGVALVAWLAWRMYLGASAAVRLLCVLTLILVIGQVALGFGILAVGNEQAVMSHEGNAFAILCLLALSGAFASRQRGRPAASRASA